MSNVRLPNRSLACLGLGLLTLLGCRSGGFLGLGSGSEAPRRPVDERLAASVSSLSDLNASIETEKPDVVPDVAEFLERTRQFDLGEVNAQPDSSSRRDDSTRSAALAGTGSKPLGVEGPTVGPDEADSAIVSIPSSNSVAANHQLSIDGQDRPQRRRPSLPVVTSVSIRPVESAILADPLVERMGGPNEAMDATPDDAKSIAEIVDGFKRSAERDPESPESWQYPLMAAVSGRPEPNPSTSFAVLPERTRGVVIALHDLISAVSTLVMNPGERVEPVWERTERLQDALAGELDPSVETIAICQRVTTFGVYDEIPESALTAGRITPVIVYSELRNLRATPTPDGQFKSVLATRLELFKPDGASLWRQEEPEIVDVCRRRRTDFFVAQRASFPATLPSGEIILKVTVEDRVAGRVSESTKMIRVQDSSLASKVR